MKHLFYILLLISSVDCTAQSKQTRIALSNAELFERIVFESKDSSTIESLFARNFSFEKSDGKIESRQEAITNIIHNKSVYTKDLQPFPYDFFMRGDSAVVKHRYRAIEKKADGSIVNVELNITTVWIKESGKLRLITGKAINN